MSFPAPLQASQIRHVDLRGTRRGGVLSKRERIILHYVSTIDFFYRRINMCRNIDLLYRDTFDGRNNLKRESAAERFSLAQLTEISLTHAMKRSRRFQDGYGNLFFCFEKHLTRERTIFPFEKIEHNFTDKRECVSPRDVDQSVLRSCRAVFVRTTFVPTHSFLLSSSDSIR